MTGKIYFVSAPGRIKIGYTAKPEVRLKQLRDIDMEELTTLAVADGTTRIERALHKLVADHCIRGEWFRDCPEVRTVMEDYVSGKLAFDKFGEPPEPEPTIDMRDNIFEYRGRAIDEATKEATALCDEIERRAKRGEPVSDLVRAACFLAEKIIAPTIKT